MIHLTNTPGAAAFVFAALFVAGCASAPTPAAPAAPPVAAIDFKHSGVGIPVDQLTAGSLDREQLRAIGEAAKRTLETKYPNASALGNTTATPGHASHGAPAAPAPPPSFADADTFEQNLQPLFNNVATNYVAAETQAKARGLPTSSLIPQMWAMYNQWLKMPAFPQAQINALCLQLIKALADETDRLRIALESHG
jgi:hypothetical protein